MKTKFLAVAAVMVLGMSAAYAGEGGYTAGAFRWQAENGNATIPATQLFARQQRAIDYPQQQSQFAYVLPPFHGSQDNGQE